MSELGRICVYLFITELIVLVAYSFFWLADAVVAHKKVEKLMAKISRGEMDQMEKEKRNPMTNREAQIILDKLILEDKVEGGRCNGGDNGDDST